LSVISLASIDGASAHDQQARWEGELRRRPAPAVFSYAREARAHRLERHVLGGRVEEHERADLVARSWPVITASWISGSAAAISRTRTAPALTQVPVESLKSSATAAVEHDAARRVGGVGELDRVADR
jgi:hypothetical protein